MVRDANKAVYNAKTVEEYERNESIFSQQRQEEILGNLRRIRRLNGGGRLLDVGCGTGNVARLAASVFPTVFGADIGYKLLVRSARQRKEIAFTGAEGENLPFRDRSFDCVSMYAFLHHVLDPRRVFEEAFRLLKSGGVLYTDHDMNFHLVRFYYPFYRFVYSFRPSHFSNRLEDMAEIHNTFIPGVDPLYLKRLLTAIGFTDVKVDYWITDNRGLSLPRRTFVRTLRFLASLLPSRSFYTHFSVTARKP